MDPLFQDERISAYLDGQLAADERARFEDDLARNGELRQVVEELRGLHESLQALPRRRLADDFAQHVLRRAERAMLAEPAASSAGNLPSGSLSNGNFSSGNGETAGSVGRNEPNRSLAGADAAGDSSPWGTRRSRRPWVWAAVAIAVAVLIMIFNPPANNKRNQVASRDASPRVPQRQAEKSGPVQEPNIAAAPAERQQLRKRSEQVAEQQRTQAGALGLRRNGDRLAGSPSAPIADGGGKNLPLAPLAAPPTARANSPAIPSPVMSSPAVPGAGPVPADSYAVNRADKSSDMKRPSIGKGSDQHLKELPGAASSKDRTVEFGIAGRGQASAGENWALQEGWRAREHLPPGAMFVAVCTTNPVATQEAFKRLLVSRGITLNESPAANLALISAVRSVAISAERSASDGKLAFGSSAAPEVLDRVAAADKAVKQIRAPKPGASEKDTTPAPSNSAVASNAEAANAQTPKSESASAAPPAASKPRQAAAARGGAAPAARFAAPAAPSSPVAARTLSPLATGGSSSLAKAAAVDSEPLEVVYVVGTRQQVLGLLDDLQARPAEYRRLAVAAVTPAPADASPQQDLGDNQAMPASGKRRGDVLGRKAAEESPLALDEAGSGNVGGGKVGNGGNVGGGSADKPTAQKGGQDSSGELVHGGGQKTANKSDDRAAQSATQQSRATPSGPTGSPSAKSFGAQGAPAAPSPAPATGAEQFEYRSVEPSHVPSLNQAPAAGAGLAGAGGVAAEKKEAAKEVETNKSGGSAASRAAGAKVTLEDAVPGAGAPRAADAALGAVVDSDAVADPADRSSGSAWAARMKLPPDTENSLRRSLAERESAAAERESAMADGERSLHADKLGANGSFRGTGQLRDDKQKSDSQSKSGEVESEQAPPAQSKQNADGDQVQAVFVFRLRPSDSHPAGTH